MKIKKRTRASLFQSLEDGKQEDFFMWPYCQKSYLRSQYVDSDCRKRDALLSKLKVGMLRTTSKIFRACSWNAVESSSRYG